MAYLVKLSTLISRLCQFIGGISLVIIVLVTILDVGARYIFKLTGGDMGFTVKGSVEIVSYFMLFALLAAFAAYVSAHKSSSTSSPKRCPKPSKAT